MLRSFEDSNIRVLIRYMESPVYKEGGHDLETIPGNKMLAKQQHLINGIEIINVATKEIIYISQHTAIAITENIREILSEVPPPVSVNEAEIAW